MARQIIPTFELSFDAEFRRKFKEETDRIFDEAFLTDHRCARRFESEFARFSGLRFATAVSSGTAAIETLLLALGAEGREVLLPTNTFIATAAAVERAGGLPIALDIEERFFGLSPSALAERLAAGHANKPAAVIAVHIGGLISPDILAIEKICSEAGIPLIEDCAHAHGCSLQGRPAGSFGIAGCFSFFPTKVITSAEGGMIVTNDARLEERLRSARRFGQDLAEPLSHTEAGSNFKMTEFQALLGSMDLARSGDRIRRRQALARRYRERLQGTSWRTIAPAPEAVSTHYKQIVLSPLPRDEVSGFLAARGISLTGGVYFIPLHRQPRYRKRFAGESFPAADRFADAHFCPPCYPELEEADVDRVCDALLELSP